jgi:hypothetical protein
MKLREPNAHDNAAMIEERYLTHCVNVALLISSSSDSEEFDGKIKKYFEVTDAN